MLKLLIKSLALLTLLITSTLVSANNYELKCDFKFDDMLKMSPRNFDQDFEKGWVQVADKEGCKEASANLISLYYTVRDLPAPVTQTLKFHEAQLRAELGQTQHAISLFKETLREKNKNGWNYYVLGTIAFLEKDREKLTEAIQSLSNVKKPEGFNPVDSNGNPIKVEWPPNLDVLQRYNQCFEKGYLEAYSGCSDTN
ncbi:hypothetical protein [Idiomarina sp.]|uniref:hypothetical protein n=1 Tax=Idiomarina sp. TaxID=1874361 RepID=UPI0025827E80|nr:hypothetical protein [Idiomarina sp.]